METALNLEKLLEGDSVFRTDKEIKIEVNKRFAKLFPKPKESGRFIFKKIEYPKLTKEQIKTVLVENGLVKEGADPNVATDEAIKRHYDIETYGDLYKFIELKNGSGNTIYSFELRRYMMADGI